MRSESNIISNPNPFNGEMVRALTWKEPFATMMLFSKIDTRTWPTNYRGLVLICAGKKPYNMHQIIHKISGMGHWHRMVEVFYDHTRNLTLTYGHAIAIGRLVNCRPMRKQDEDLCFVKFRKGLFCHLYQDIRPIVPFQFKGQHRWKILDPDMKSKIEIADKH